MIHYTCDRCKRTIDPETEPRYVVEIDVRLAGPVEQLGEDAEDLDPLAELHDQLQRESSADPDRPEDAEQLIPRCDDVESGPEQYDLCPQCHDAFVNNPLGREIAVGLGFSNN